MNNNKYKIELVNSVRQEIYEEFGRLTIFLLKILGKFKDKILIFKNFGRWPGGGTIYILKILGNIWGNFIKLEKFGHHGPPPF